MCQAPLYRRCHAPNQGRLYRQRQQSCCRGVLGQSAKNQLALNWGECCLYGVLCRLYAWVTVCADCVVRGELNNFLADVQRAATSHICALQRAEVAYLHILGQKMCRDGDCPTWKSNF